MDLLMHHGEDILELKLFLWHIISRDYYYLEVAKSMADQMCKRIHGDGGFRDRKISRGDIDSFSVGLASLKSLILFYRQSGNMTYLNYAKRMGDWFVDHQYEDGSIGSTWDNKKDEWTTPNMGYYFPALNIEGMTFLAAETNEEKYITSLSKLVEYVIALQRDDGSYDINPKNKMRNAFSVALLASAILQAAKSIPHDRPWIRSAHLAMQYVFSDQELEDTSPRAYGGIRDIDWPSKSYHNARYIYACMGAENLFWAISC